MRPDRRTRKKKEMRDRILRAAIESFLAAGFDATTMEAIAERADVARQTVFNHFPDKRSLLDAYLASRRDRLVELLRAETASGATAAQRLLDALDLLAGVNEGSPAEARELVGAWFRTGGNTTDHPQTALVLADVIRAGQRDGELRKDVDAELAARLLFDAYAGILLRWVSEEPSFPLRHALREACSLVLDGLRREPLQC